jgi:hypothetical protein
MAKIDDRNSSGKIYLRPSVYHYRWDNPALRRNRMTEEPTFVRAPPEHLRHSRRLIAQRNRAVTVNPTATATAPDCQAIGPTTEARAAISNSRML